MLNPFGYDDLCERPCVFFRAAAADDGNSGRSFVKIENVQGAWYKGLTEVTR
jgi:hypothetical protein